MLELEGELLEVYLLPGELHVAREPAIIRTILGSCVGVTLWSERLGVGALCHSLLPRHPAAATSPGGLSSGLARSSTASSSGSLAHSRRYLDFSIRDMARQLDEMGVIRSEVQVKLFGGADVLSVKKAANAKPTVGKMNCEAALEVVRAEGFNVVASSLGGTAGLSIKFNTRTGVVLLKRLPRVVLEDGLED
jgi:chemotaxis protein CheD